MALQFNSVKCPDCGANLEIEKGREKFFCSYCGRQIIVTNENEYTYRHLNEADVKRAETERLVYLKELEFEKENRAIKKFLTKVWLILTIGLLILGIIGLVWDNEGLSMCLLLAMNVGGWGALGLAGVFSDKKKKRKIVNANEVQISEKMCDYEDKNYNSIVELYSAAGFTNIKAVPLNDLNIFTSIKNGKVEEITIGGEDDFDEGNVFLKTDMVIITYHSIH